MRKFGFRFAVTVITFGIGISISSLWAALYFSVAPVQEASVPATLPEEERWHRLLEAAGMTGKPEITQEAYNQLMCTNRAGLSNAERIEIDQSIYCKQEDGTLYRVDRLSGEYGGFNKLIFDSHPAWALRNMEFVRSVGTAETAERYFRGHLSPSQ